MLGRDDENPFRKRGAYVRILTVVGARPQFVKAAPVCRAFALAGIEEVLVHTGQHFDSAMSAVFFDELSIPAPKYNLEIHGGGHGDMTGRMLVSLEPIVHGESPDAVLVYGDTNSTLAGALVASKLHIPLVHVEAGLRSFNMRMPEEINRKLSDQVSNLLLCPTRTAVANLASEGIRDGVYHVGDVMYDATLLAVEIARERSDVLERLGLGDKGFAVATVHRAENTDDPARLSEILRWLKARASDHEVVCPVHPRLKEKAERHGLSLDALNTCEPLGYLDMALLLDRAEAVYTDSGGLQKEAYFHRKPCVTLREETEWVETVQNGWNRLWKTRDYQPRQDIDDYGSGRSALSIVAHVQGMLMG